MVLSDAERDITNVVVQRFLSQNQAISRKELALKFKPYGTDAILHLVRLNVLRREPFEQFLPNAIAFHLCGDADALQRAKSSVELIIPALQSLYEATQEGALVSTLSLAVAVDSYSPNANREVMRRGLYFCQEMALIGGWAWDKEQTKHQTFSINERVINVEARTAWDVYIKENLPNVELTNRREARAKFLRGLFDLAGGREGYALPPMQWVALASNLGMTEDERNSIVREILSEEVIGQKPASQAFFLTRKGMNELQGEVARVNLGEPEPMSTFADSRKIFLVHGHDEAVKQTVARFLEKLNLDVVILHEQPSKSRTVIEKFEQNADVAFAVVLLTPDDIGGSASEPLKQKTRARQNVILELGYFFGKLGRARVSAIYVEGVELPSDIYGVIYVPFDAAGGWRLALAQEIKAAGIEVDLNRAVTE